MAASEPPIKRQKSEGSGIASANAVAGDSSDAAVPQHGQRASPQQQQQQEEAHAQPIARDAAPQQQQQQQQPGQPAQQRPGGMLPHTSVSCACSEDKGCRQAMEDVWVAERDARGSKDAPVRVSFFAVFDGHGGRGCAAYAAEHLHAAALQAGLVSPEAAAGDAPVDVKRVRQAVTEAFKRTDADLCKVCEEKGWLDGAAAVACWLVGDLCVVANAGDAKAVLARAPDDKQAGGPGPLKALTLTKEHLAIHAAERQRIAAAGGFVSKDGRLNGRIQVSRSFGDAQFKRSGATAAPDMQVFTLTPRDRFLLLACDGFWGVFDGQGAVAMVQQLLAEGRDAKAVTNRLINAAVRERRCKDNCTCLLVVFETGGASGGGGGGTDVSGGAAARQSA